MQALETLFEVWELALDGFIKGESDAALFLILAALETALRPDVAHH